MVSGDAHGAGVPPVPLTVLHGGAVARAGQEAAGGVGVGVVGAGRERPQGTFAYTDAVIVDIVLGAGGSVLQVVSAVMLGHPGPLDIGIVRQGGAQQGAVALRRGLDGRCDICHILRAAAGGFGDPLSEDLRDGAGGGVIMMLLAGALVAVFRLVVVNQRHGLSNPLHGLRVQLHAPDGGHVATAPVEVQPSVIVQEKVGVPEVEGAGKLFEYAAFRIFCAVEVADFPLAAGAEVHPVPDGPHIRSVIVERHACQRAQLPARHVLADQEASGHAGEEIVFSPEQDHGRIGGLPVQGEASLLLVELVLVGEVDWVAEIFFHSCPPYRNQISPLKTV